MSKLSKLAAAVALTFVAGAASALPVVDSFSVDQGFVTDNNSAVGPVWATQVGGILETSILGGFRDIFVDATDGASGGLNVNAGVQGGSFSYNASSGVKATGVIRWDGAATGGAVDTIGLGGLDLSGVGSAFRVNVSPDNEIKLFFRVWTGGLMSEVMKTLAATDTFVDFSYAEFMGADFADVGAVELKINDGSVASRDLTVSLVQAVPEPGTVALLGLALLGLGAARRRKN